MQRSLFLAVLACCWAESSAAQFLTAPQVLSRPPRQADERLRYGSGPLQFGDLRLPRGPGPHPVVITIHGGCWTTIADLQYLDEFAESLTNAGWATWNIEFRRVGQPGGGWPGTLQDVGRAADFLREIAVSRRLDLEKVVTAGHSSGGHLALWVAARSRIPAGSEVWTSNPLAVSGAVSLAGAGDLKAFHEGTDRSCAADIVAQLMGGTPAAVPDRFAQASPAELLPLGVPQLILTGAEDGSVPPVYAEQYVRLAKDRGDRVELSIVPDAAHFEVIAPWSPAWPHIEPQILGFLERVRTLNSER